jgi:hypothetical protein
MIRRDTASSVARVHGTPRSLRPCLEPPLARGTANFFMEGHSGAFCVSACRRARARRCGSAGARTKPGCEVRPSLASGLGGFGVSFFRGAQRFAGTLEVGLVDIHIVCSPSASEPLAISGADAGALQAARHHRGLDFVVRRRDDSEAWLQIRLAHRALIRSNRSSTRARTCRPSRRRRIASSRSVLRRWRDLRDSRPGGPDIHEPFPGQRLRFSATRAIVKAERVAIRTSVWSTSVQSRRRG